MAVYKHLLDIVPALENTLANTKQLCLRETLVL